MDESNVYEDLGAMVREWRKSKGLSQAALGDLVGVNQSGIAKIENGERRPEFATVVRLVDALDIPWNLLRPQQRTDYDVAISAVSSFIVAADNYLNELSSIRSRATEARESFLLLIQAVEEVLGSERTNNDEVTHQLQKIGELMQLIHDSEKSLMHPDRKQARAGIEAAQDLRHLLRG